ncbi:MAG TPA: response regulator transcription factor [Trebonia sp.]|nr:response regulator transcription factor [Trebonia sp.]
MTLTREGLVAVLGREGDFDVAAVVRHGEDVARVAEAVKPDVALLAAAFPVPSPAPAPGPSPGPGPGQDGIAVSAALRKAVPDCRCAILGASWRPGDMQRAAGAGVRGFLLCDSPAGFLTDAVRQLAGGRQVADPRLSFGAQCPLTTREADALRAAAQGSSTAEIADLLCLSEGTVRNYLSRAIAKTGARNRVDAIRIAGESGWL